jgi:hypothetical protein
MTIGVWGTKDRKKHLTHAFLLTSVLSATGTYLVPAAKMLDPWVQNLIYRGLSFPMFIFVTMAVWGKSNE